MRTISMLCATVLVAASAPTSAQVAQIEPNSEFFNVPGYLAPDASGKWNDYTAAGFAQPAIEGAASRLWIMPKFRLTRNSAKFTEASGNNFDPTLYPDKRAQAIGVSVGYDLSLPTSSQLPAIGASLSGVTLSYYLAPWPQQAGGDPVMSQSAQFDMGSRTAVLNSFASYKAAVDKQQEYAAKYAGYTPILATMKELRVAVLVDGEEVAVRSFPGTAILTGNQLPQITITEPTVYVQNKIANGGYEVLVGYRFLDARMQSIEASYNTRQAVSQFVEETQTAITSKKSSGWQVMGFGSRRSKVKSSLEQSMKSDTAIAQQRGTRVVMYDASEDMINQFEATFFPSLSRQETITRHLDAAEKAQQAGNLDLARAHSEYAASLQNDNPMQEVNSVAAAAALTAGDYAGFLAHGVRMSSSSNSMTNHFRRVIDMNVEVVNDEAFTSVKSTSVLRETSLPVLMQEARRYVAHIGILAGVTFPYNFVRQNTWGNPEMESRNGFLVTTVLPGGPLWQAGIFPGAVLTSIGGKAPTNLPELGNVLESFEPGKTINVKVLMTSGSLPTVFQQGLFGQEQNVTVNLGRRPAPKSPDDE